MTNEDRLADDAAAMGGTLDAAAIGATLDDLGQMAHPLQYTAPGPVTGEALYLGGAAPADVVLSAHYDSQAEGRCVYDNGSGLSGLIETARALRELEPQRRVVLAASAAEEIGVWLTASLPAGDWPGASAEVGV
jgi:Peptidase family M28